MTRKRFAIDHPELDWPVWITASCAEHAVERFRKADRRGRWTFGRVSKEELEPHVYEATESEYRLAVESRKSFS